MIQVSFFENERSSECLQKLKKSFITIVLCIHTLYHRFFLTRLYPSRTCLHYHITLSGKFILRYELAQLAEKVIPTLMLKQREVHS